MERLDIINKFVEKCGYDSYLEIGVGASEVLANVNCSVKVGVDPDPSPTNRATHRIPSDQFFEENDDEFDIIMVDGLHEANQSLKDILNSLKCISEDGTVIVHDCNPLQYEHQAVPQITTKWNGDVWKAWVNLRAGRQDLDMFVLNTDEGVGIIRKGHQDLLDLPPMFDYYDLEANRRDWLNLVREEYLDDYLRTI